MRFLADLRLLLLALWLGAAIFFVVVAQSAFAVLPTREIAGTLVTRTLAILNYSGLGIAIILVLTSLIVTTQTKRAALWLERVFLIIVGLACAIGQFVFSWWLLLLRTQMGRPIDEVPAEDPLRIQFNDLHEYSSWTLITAMVAGLLAFFVISSRRSQSVRRNPFDGIDISKQFKV